MRACGVCVFLCAGVYWEREGVSLSYWSVNLSSVNVNDGIMFLYRFIFHL